GRHALLPPARGPRLCDRGRLRALDPQAYPRGRRALHLSRLALRDRRHGRQEDRQALRLGDQAGTKGEQGRVEKNKTLIPTFSREREKVGMRVLFFSTLPCSPFVP